MLKNSAKFLILITILLLLLAPASAQETYKSNKTSENIGKHESEHIFIQLMNPLSYVLAAVISITGAVYFKIYFENWRISRSRETIIAFLRNTTEHIRIFFETINRELNPSSRALAFALICGCVFMIVISYIFAVYNFKEVNIKNFIISSLSFGYLFSILILVVLCFIVFPIASIIYNLWKRAKVVRFFKCFFFFMVGIAVYNLSILLTPQVSMNIQATIKIKLLGLALLPFIFLLLPALIINDFNKFAKSKVIDDKINELREGKIIIKAKIDDENVCGFFWDYSQDGLIIKNYNEEFVFLPWDKIIIIKIKEEQGKEKTKQ